jgi:hypothetical protein
VARRQRAFLIRCDFHISCVCRPDTAGDLNFKWKFSPRQEKMKGTREITCPMTAECEAICSRGRRGLGDSHVTTRRGAILPWNRNQFQLNYFTLVGEIESHSNNWSGGWREPNERPPPATPAGGHRVEGATRNKFVGSGRGKIILFEKNSVTAL